MSRGRGRGRRARPVAPEHAPEPLDTLPPGRMPSVGIRELVAAIHRRRSRRRETAAELGAALRNLAAGVEAHLARVAQLRDAVEAQGGDLAQLQVYDNVMARLRAELRSAERSLAEAFSQAAREPAGGVRA